METIVLCLAEHYSHLHDLFKMKITYSESDEIFYVEIPNDTIREYYGEKRLINRIEAEFKECQEVEYPLFIELPVNLISICEYIMEHDYFQRHYIQRCNTTKQYESYQKIANSNNRFEGVLGSSITDDTIQQN